jgi:hypothetical protein
METLLDWPGRWDTPLQPDSDFSVSTALAASALPRLTRTQLPQIPFLLICGQIGDTEAADENGQL